MDYSLNTILAESIKKNWESLALTDFNGVSYQYRDIARKVAKLHILFENSGIKKGDKIATCGATKIIYVSCNPDTLARDISRLSGYYQIDEIVPFEMFPQTKHIECLVVLSKVKV